MSLRLDRGPYRRRRIIRRLKRLLVEMRFPREMVDAILTKRAADVRLFYMISIFSLLISTLLMAWINMSLLNSLITTAIFYAFAGRVTEIKDEDW